MGYLKNLFDRIFAKNSSKNPGKVAKKRLECVIGHDRVDVSPQYVEDIKAKIVLALSAYMEIDEKNTDIYLTAEEGKTVFVANIGVHRINRLPSNSTDDKYSLGK